MYQNQGRLEVSVWNHIDQPLLESSAAYEHEERKKGHDDSHGKYGDKTAHRGDRRLKDGGYPLSQFQLRYEFRDGIEIDSIRQLGKSLHQAIGEPGKLGVKLLGDIGNAGGKVSHLRGGPVDHHKGGRTDYAEYQDGDYEYSHASMDVMPLQEIDHRADHIGQEEGDRKQRQYPSEYIEGPDDESRGYDTRGDGYKLKQPFRS